MPFLFALPLIFRQTFGATLAVFVVADEVLAANGASQVVLFRRVMKAAMFGASKALQVFNLIVRLVEVDVMNIAALRYLAVVKSPNVAMNC